jgi:uncharacterized membrane protein YkoI
MKINKTIAIAVLLFGLLAGGLATGVLLSRRPLSVNAAPPAQEVNDTGEADDVEDNDENEAGETEEAVSPDQANITADEAKAAAEAAYPGAKAVAVELENENGKIAYEVELDNGLEVIVDAGSGEILGTEQD